MADFKVFATAGEAYRFLARELGTILRLSWLPLLIATVLQNFIAIAVMGRTGANVPDPSTSLLSPSALFAAAIGFFIIVAGTAIVAVALHRVILFGERREGEFFYLRFGRTELLFMLLPLAVYLAVTLLFLVLFVLLPTWLFAVPALIFLLALIYFGIRFSLIFPVTVMKGRYDFDEVQAITRGHFWRLFALWLLTMLPALFVSTLLQRLVTFGSLSVDLDQLANYVLTTPTLIALSVLQIIVAIVLGALGVATLSYSYKALIGGAPDEVLTPQG
jgi:hypothetical protein